MSLGNYITVVSRSRKTFTQRIALACTAHEMEESQATCSSDWMTITYICKKCGHRFTKRRRV